MLQVHRDAVVKTPQTPKPQSGPVSAVTVEPRVWGETMALTGGDPRLFEVVSTRKVRILDTRYSPPR